MRRALLSVLVALLGGYARGADETLRDCAVGLEKLANMAGVPDLSTAEYGRLQLNEKSSAGAYLQLQLVSDLPGEHAWRMGSAANRGTSVQLRGWLPVVIGFGGLDGTWHVEGSDAFEASVRERLQRWTAYAAEADLTAPNDWLVAAGSELLLDSAVLYRTGREGPAKEIATKLLGSKAAEVLIEASFVLASHCRYHRALVGLAASGDRPAFRNELQDILDQFSNKTPAGFQAETWLKADKATAKPKTAGLTDTQKEVFAALLDTSSCDLVPETDDWLLFAPREYASTDGKGALERLLALGMESLPVILALAEDERPTSCMEGAWFGEGRSYGDDYVGQAGMMMAMDEGLSAAFGPSVRRYLGLARPDSALPRFLTGKELAEELMLTVLPRKGRDWGDETVSEMVERLSQWYEAHRGMSRREVALARLRDHENSSSALHYLAQTKPTEEEWAIVDEALMGVDSEDLYLCLYAYVTARRENARPLVEKLKQQRTTAREIGMFAEMEEGLKPRPKPIKLSPGEFRDLVARIASEEGNDENACQSIRLHLSATQPPVEAARLLLKAAAANSERPGHTALVGLFLQAIQSCVPRSETHLYGRYGLRPWEDLERTRAARAAGSSERPIELPPELLAQLPLDELRAEWLAVLPPSARATDHPTHPDSAEQTTSEICQTILMLYTDRRIWCEVYRADSYRFLPDNVLVTEDQATLLPGGCTELLWREAKATLDGLAPAALPSSIEQAVSDQRVAELLDQLRPLPYAEAMARIAALEPLEKVRLLFRLRSDTELHRRLVEEPRQHIPETCTFTGNVPPAARLLVEEIKGKELSKELIDNILDKAVKAAAEGHSFAMQLTDGPGLEHSLSVDELEDLSDTTRQEIDRIANSYKMGPGVIARADATCRFGWSEAVFLPCRSSKTNADNDDVDEDLDAIIGWGSRDEPERREVIRLAASASPDLLGWSKLELLVVSPALWKRWEKSIAQEAEE